MPDPSLPDLTFPGMTYGAREVPWDLRRWMYSGGASVAIETANAEIKNGKFGPPRTERIELVRKIHEALSDALERGIRRTTVLGRIEAVTYLFRWVDHTNQNISLDSLEAIYRCWTDSLLHRVRVAREISEGAAYDYGSVAGSVLDRVLSRTSPIVRSTRLRKPKRASRAVSLQRDKQNLEQTFALGHFLLDLADGLSVEKIWGVLPIHIPIRNGRELKEWSGHKREPRKPPNPKYPRQTNLTQKQSRQRHATWEADKTFRTRYPIINLRIQAEMFMLMGQPGINVAQVHQVRMDQWRYKPSTHGYEIRTYKHRRWGSVLFEIYSSFRPVFERYLQWRAAIFPGDPDGLLFPLLGKCGAPTTRHPESAPSFEKIKGACTRGGIIYLPPSTLRSTNVNWMLRRTQDPNLTAEEKQHSTKTLLRYYERPHQQRAMGQIKKFWAKHDPTQAAAGPGACLGTSPIPVSEIPPSAPPVDCLTPSGCLFCAQQRDIDSLDHIWSLATFRQLKSLDLNRQGTSKSKSAQQEHPAETVIARVTEKLNYISASSPRRSEWVEEALLRVEEGRYHPSWAGLIESL